MGRDVGGPPRAIGAALPRAEPPPHPTTRIGPIFVGVVLLLAGLTDLAALRWGHAHPILENIADLSVWPILAVGTLWLVAAFRRSRGKGLLASREEGRPSGLECARKERGVMLREFHHRVKNHLQIIASLLRLEAGECVEASAAGPLERSIRRIAAMALVHESLCQSEAPPFIDLGTYLQELVRSVRATLDSSVTVDLEIRRSRTVDPDFAVPFGLLVTEIITSLAAAHDAPRWGGLVRLSVDCGASIDLVVNESESAGSPLLDLVNAKGLSPALIRSVIEQLHGRVDIAPRRGVRLEVDMPAPRSA